MLAHRSALVSFGINVTNMRTEEGLRYEKGVAGIFNAGSDAVTVETEDGEFNPVAAAHEFGHRGIQQLFDFYLDRGAVRSRTLGDANPRDRAMYDRALSTLLEIGRASCRERVCQ